MKDGAILFGTVGFIFEKPIITAFNSDLEQVCHWLELMSRVSKPSQIEVGLDLSGR